MTTSFKLTNEISVNKTQDSSQALIDKTSINNEITLNGSITHNTITSPTTKVNKLKLSHRLISNQVTDHNYRSSSSSMNSSIKMSTASVDDDDERFYDAIDAAENSNVFSPSINSVMNKRTAYSFGNEEDDDEDTSCFFDTKTSRHASELSDCSVVSFVGSLPNFRNKPSIVFNDNDVVEENHKETSTFYNEKNNNDGDDEYDVELETEWSFWVDRLLLSSFYKNFKIKRKQTLKVNF